MKKIKLFRISTVPISLNILLKGQLQFLNQYFAVTAVSGAGDDLSEVKDREKVNVIPLEMQRNISPFRDFISLIRLYFLFKKEKPAIVHSITPKAGLLTMLAGKLAGVPVRIHTFTGLVFPSKYGLMQKLLIWMDRLLCWSATDIYPEGEGVKKDLIKFSITSKPLKVIANGSINGIDVNYFSLLSYPKEKNDFLRSELGINPDDFVFIYVGRLVKDKGINELISVFKKFSKLQDNVKLLLVGPTEEYLDPLIPDTINEIKDNEKIISLGFKKDVRPYFAIADCLVFPSYREGFPNVVIQAGAMELPSIVSDINGCNEIILDNQNGIIIPVKNEEKLYQAMQQLFENKNLYSGLKDNSRNMIVNRYKKELIWTELLEEYYTLIHKRIKRK